MRARVELAHGRLRGVLEDFRGGGARRVLVLPRVDALDLEGVALARYVLRVGRGAAHAVDGAVDGLLEVGSVV